VTASEAFWPWAVRQYGRPEVQSLCLELQDRHEQCVPYLLWAAWLGASGRAIPAQALQEGAGLARVWAGEVIDPLRQVRRHLKDAGAEDLRRTVKAAELEAEKTLMARLETLAAEPQGACALEQMVISAGQLWNPAPDMAVLKSFAAMFR
jgi:uncharacterized protein (TIGR02444 family)